MKIVDFKKLESNIEKQDFYISYKNIDKTLFFLAIFGNIASVFCAFFFLSKLVFDSITFISNPIIVWVACLIILTGVELLKREIFDKFSLEFIRYQSIFKKEVINLCIASLTIISISFYCSLKGAKEFSSKNDYIVQVTETNLKSYTDSISSVYNTKISGVESESSLIKSKIESKDGERTKIESNTTLTSQNKRRISDLKKDEAELKASLIHNDTIVSHLKSDLKSEIQTYVNSKKDITVNELDKNKHNSFIFVILSLCIELTILVGIYFHKYYHFKSYDDFKVRVNKDPNYQRWSLYNSILEVIYMNNPQPNSRVQSTNSIIMFCKINGYNVTIKSISDSLKLFGALGITKVSGNARYILVNQEEASEQLKSYFKIQ